jgi:hypothetical protein
VTLPPSCDRNHFRITMVRKDQREDLAEQQLTWDRKDSERGAGFQFSPKELAAKGGLGEYEAKFYSGPEPVLRTTFKIE